MKLRFVPVAILGAMLAVTNWVAAAPTDLDVSRAIARAHLERIGATGRAIGRQADVVEGECTLARIFALEPTGYVVVAADTDLPPVIAYALESPYPDSAQADNPLLRLLTADLKARIAARERIDAATLADWSAEWDDLRTGSPVAARFEQWPPAGSTPTGGWLRSNWTQGAPYNTLCPQDRASGGARSVAGCPAVAMGMILNYHESTRGMKFDDGDRYWHNFAGKAYWIPDAAAEYDFPDFVTLNGYLTTLTGHWTAGVPPTGTDMAALVFACGVAAHQVYSASVSGTYGVDQAYAAYQRFGFAECRLLLADAPDLFTALAAEMQDANPTHLAVVDPGWTMGHNVVVDGYNSDDYYHLNFGWGGSYNGWYLLPEEVPYGLTVIEGLILDVTPGATAVEEDAAPSATTFAPRLAAHPNPFNPRTVIAFTAPAAGRARLTIHDLAGRRVAVLLDGTVGTGRQTAGWTPHDQPSGVYLARLEIGGTVVSTRVVLAK
ncbi:thiol protease/hemagglutinin PrtT [bacterium]|nr:thiol protease/hemagglutinin PrtT [bacterium]MBU1676264.1 thiol protease/hemagglutinin PrtT [bacterium]